MILYMLMKKQSHFVNKKIELTNFVSDYICNILKKILIINMIMNIKYNEIEANNSLKFLKDVYLLPKDAKKIY